jgi:MFS family permease
MQQEPGLMQPRGIAIPTDTGYQVMEGQGALINRNSIIFAIGQGISLIGDGFYLQTLIIWVTAISLAGAKTPAQQAVALAAVAAIQAGIFGSLYLANFLILPFVGVFVDRWDRRTTMIIADLVQAVLALLPLVAFFTAKDAFIPALFVSYFLLTIAQGFFMGSQSGVLQVIVARKNLPQAVSILFVLLGAGGVAGALYAPPFFLAVGPVIAIVVNAVSFLVSAVALLLLRVPKEALHPYAFKQNAALVASAGVSKGILGVLKDLLHGLRFSIVTSVLLGIVIMLIVVQVGAAAVNSLTSSFLFANLHANPAKDLGLLGILPSTVGIGYIIGAALIGACARFLPLKALAVVSILGLGLGWIVFALQSTLTNGVIVFAITGVFNGAFVVSYTSLVLKVTPNSIIGRVEAVLTPLASLSSFLATLVIGAVVQAHNPAADPAGLFTSILVGGGVAAILASIVGFLLVRKAKEEAAGAEVISPAIAVAGTPEILASDD